MALPVSDFDERTRAFTAWFGAAERRKTGTHLGPGIARDSSSGQQDGVTSCAQIKIMDRRLEGRGRAVIATQDIEADTTLFTVSHEDILSIATSDVRNIIPAPQIDSLIPWTACVLALIYEHGRGKTGKWWPYLSILPETFDTLMHWNEAELAELQGSHVVGKIGRVDAESVFETQLWPIVRAHASDFGDHSAEFSDIDEQRALNALKKLSHRFATLVVAYAFDLDQDEGAHDPEKTMDEDGFIEDTAPPKGMVPYADMLNAEGEQFNNARLFHNDGSVSMIATQSIRAGEEIFNDYGSLPNAEILRCYGYTASAYEPHDVVELETKEIAKKAQEISNFDDRQIEKRLNLADRWDVIDESFDLSRNPSQEQLLDDGLLLTSAILMSDDNQYREYKQAKRPPKVKLSRQTAELLIQAIQQRQKEYRTTIAEDQAVLRDEKVEQRLSRRKLMAIAVRLGEKEVLAQNLDYLRAWLSTSGQEKESDLSSFSKKRKT